MRTKVPTLRTSERTAWRKCPQAWWWGYREGLVPKGLPALPLWFGTGWHLALATYYGKGKRRYPKRARQVLIDYFDSELEQIKTIDGEGAIKYVEAKALALNMWDNYIATYGADDHMYIIAVERSEQVEIFDADGNFIAVYAFTMDGVYRDERDHNKIKLLEHKTATIIQLAWLALDDQAGSYLAFMTEVLRHEGVLGPDEFIQDVTYNIARKEVVKKDDRPRNADGLALNKDGSISKNQNVQAPLLVRQDIPRSAESRNRLIERVAIEVEQMNEMRADPTRVYKNPQGGPFGCQTCPFFQMCQLHEEGGDWEDLRDWQFVVRDPYADHRKAA